jgi:hypothetical protein
MNTEEDKHDPLHFIHFCKNKNMTGLEWQWCKSMFYKNGISHKSVPS